MPPAPEPIENHNLKPTGATQSPSYISGYSGQNISVSFTGQFPPKEAEKPVPESKVETPLQQNGKLPKKKYLIGGGVITAFLIPVFVKMVIPAVGTISGVVTICQVDKVSSAGPFMQKFCDIVSAPPPPEQPDRDGVERIFFLGGWTGKWDDKWTVGFNVKEIQTGRESNHIKIDYIHQEDASSSSLSTTSLDCEFINVLKVYCPLRLEIKRTSLYATDAIATFRSENGHIRIAKLVRFNHGAFGQLP